MLSATIGFVVLPRSIELKLSVRKNANITLKMIF